MKRMSSSAWIVVLGALAFSALCEAIKGWNVAFLSGNIAKDLRGHVYRAL